MERLNLFNPFKDKDISHEDVLTRNFLLLIKNINAVQIAFFELIRNKMKSIGLESIALGDLSVVEVYTQVTSGNLLAGIQEHKILSIVISDDNYQSDHIVEESTRNARYDGVVICDPSWVFIIENKPFVVNIWEGQLDPNTEDANGNDLIQNPCSLSWREIIDVLNAVLNHNIFNIIEKTLIEDFLEYINETYPWLNPYTRFELCKGNKVLIDKRCGDILKQCFPNFEYKYHQGWKHYIDTSAEDAVVRQIALDYDENSIMLCMHAGNTMASSREFYKRIDPELVKGLDEKYVIRTDFHFSYRGTGLVWFSTSKINIFEYIDYWKRNEPKQIQRDQFVSYYNGLKEDNIIDSKDEEMEKTILSKQYPNLNVCYGIQFGYKWSLEEAIILDNGGKFVDECREKINRIYAIYGHGQI